MRDNNAQQRWSPLINEDYHLGTNPYRYKTGSSTGANHNSYTDQYDHSRRAYSSDRVPKPFADTHDRAQVHSGGSQSYLHDEDDSAQTAANETSRKDKKATLGAGDGTYGTVNCDESSAATYYCLYPGCSYASKRQYDLHRHMKIHFPPPVNEMFDCPARGCIRTGANGSKRKDWMNEHLSAVHMIDPKTGKVKKAKK